MSSTLPSFMEQKCRDILLHYQRLAQTTPSKSTSYQRQVDAYWILEQLSPKHQHVAAEGSYAYWYWYRYCHNTNQEKANCTTNNNNNNNNSTSTGSTGIPTTTVTSSTPTTTTTTIEKSIFLRAAALREIYRHLEGVQYREEAMKLLEETITFRIEQQTTLYRTCMDIEKVIGNDDKDESNSLEQQRKQRIHNEMNNFQISVTRGHDRDGRAILFVHPRQAAGTDEQAFTDAVLYAMERAVACTEFNSKGTQEKVLVILDCKGSSAPPSVKASKACIQIMQSFYPGRLKNLIILNPPYILLALYQMVKPFMDPETSAKFKIIKSDKQKEIEIGALIDASQAMPVMLSGQGQLSLPVDCHRYLYQIPFPCLYDYDDDSWHKKQISRVGDSVSHENIEDNRFSRKSERRNSVQPPVVVKTLAVGEIVIPEDTPSSSQQQHVVIVTPVQA